MNLGKHVQHRILPIILFFATMFQSNLVLSNDIDGLVEEFFQTSQEIAFHYFEAKIERTEKMINCFERNQDCEVLTLFAESQGETSEITFSKSDFLSYLNDQYKAYRTYAGIANIRTLRASLGPGNMRIGSVSPLPGLRSLIYNEADEAGRNEVQTIETMYEAEMTGIQTHNDWVTLRNQMIEGDDQLPMSSHKDLEKNYKARLARIVEKLPFFGWLTFRTISERSLTKALKKLLRTYKRTQNKINDMNDDDRYELLGFVDIFQRALDEFNDEEALLLVEKFRKVDKAPSTWDKIWSVLTNKAMWAMIGCWTTAVFVPVAAAVIGVICGSVSAYLAAPGLYDLVNDSLRMRTFGRTGAYEHDLYARYMMNHIVSFTMYGVYLSGMTFGLHKSIKNFRTDLAATRVAFSENMRRMVTAGRSELVDEMKLFWSYTWFNGRDISLEAITDQMLKAGGIQTVLVPAAAHSMLAIIEQNRAQGYSTMLFSQLLQIYREMENNNQ